MIRHDYVSMQIELVAVFVQTTFEDNISGFRRKVPPTIRGECDEERVIVFLVVSRKLRYSYFGCIVASALRADRPGQKTKPYHFSFLTSNSFTI